MKTTLPYWLRSRYCIKRTKLFFAKLARVSKDGRKITKRPSKMTHAEEALLDERRQRFQSEESVGGCVGECNFL